MEKCIFAKGLYWADKNYVVTVTDRNNLGLYVVQDNVSQVKHICRTKESAIKTAKEWRF
jgi:hypothetical protein